MEIGKKIACGANVFFLNLYHNYFSHGGGEGGWQQACITPPGQKRGVGCVKIAFLHDIIYERPYGATDILSKAALSKRPDYGNDSEEGVS